MAIEGCCTGYFERLHGDSHLGRDHLCQVTSVPMHTGLYMLFPPLSCFLPWCLLLSESSVLCQLLTPPSNDTRRYPTLAKEHNVHTWQNAGFLSPPLRAAGLSLPAQFLGSSSGLGGSLSAGGCQVSTLSTLVMLSLSWPTVPNAHLAQGFSCKGSLWKILLGKIDYRLIYWWDLRLGDSNAPCATCCQRCCCATHLGKWLQTLHFRDLTLRLKQSCIWCELKHCLG